MTDVDGTGGETGETGDGPRGQTELDSCKAPEDSDKPNLLDRTVNRIDGIQRGLRPLAIVNAVTKKFVDDRGSQLAMLLAYKGFFSLFPLLLAFVSALGLVLKFNETLRHEIVGSTMANVPVIGTEVAKGADSLNSGTLVLVAAVAVSVWAGLGLLDMLQEALNTAWEVPFFERPSWIFRRLRGLAGALLLALCAGLSGAGRWVLVSGAPGFVQGLAGAAFPLLAGAVASLGLHRLLCARRVDIRGQLPGVIVTALGWWGLQALGGWYVTRVVNKSSDAYGAFAVVLGLLSWSYLLGTMYIYGLESSVVLHERRWPRSLSGRDLTDADVAAVGASASRTLRIEGTEIDLCVPRNSKDPGGSIGSDDLFARPSVGRTAEPENQIADRSEKEQQD